MTRGARVALAFIEPDSMPAATPFHIQDEGVGLHGRGRLCGHGYPGRRVLACRELLELLGMARGAVSGRDAAPHSLVFAGGGVIEDGRGHMFGRNVAIRARHAHIEMLTQLPVTNGATSDFSCGDEHGQKSRPRL
jgi:hypothetical protein